MESITVTEARQRLYRLLDQTAESPKPLLITGQHGKAVLVSEGDWRAIQETLYLLSIPGIRESIHQGMAAPVSQCATGPDW